MLPRLPAGFPRTHEAVRLQRVNQTQYLEDSLRNGVSPITIADMAAGLAQLETQWSLRSMAVPVVDDVAGHRRSLTSPMESGMGMI